MSDFRDIWRSDWELERERRDLRDQWPYGSYSREQDAEDRIGEIRRELNDREERRQEEVREERRAHEAAMDRRREEETRFDEYCRQQEEERQQEPEPEPPTEEEPKQS
jgi:hypothetical protein